jgi:rhamnosyltransferase
MVDPDVLFSIVIPVKNGDQWLEGLLKKLVRQTLFSKSEIIVIDSGSTDGSLEIIRRYPVRLIEIPATEFNHGATRNLGVRAAKGEYVVMTVQDALPASDDWLELFLSGFCDDGVAGVCGQQVVPHEKDKNPVLWFRPVSAHRTWYVHFENPDDFLRLKPTEQREIVGWDNVTAAYRRSVLLENPFPTTDFAEDICWARMMLLKGYKLGFVSGALTYHYHHHLPEFILPRYFSVYYYEFKIFGLRPVIRPSVFWHVLVAGKVLIKESKLTWRERIKWLFFNIRYWMVVRSTVKRFNLAANRGAEILDREYQNICKRPPQALKY